MPPLPIQLPACGPNGSGFDVLTLPRIDWNGEEPSAAAARWAALVPADTLCTKLLVETEGAKERAYKKEKDEVLDRIMPGEGFSTRADVNRPSQQQLGQAGNCPRSPIPDSTKAHHSA